MQRALAEALFSAARQQRRRPGTYRTGGGHASEQLNPQGPAAFCPPRPTGGLRTKRLPDIASQPRHEPGTQLGGERRPPGTHAAPPAPTRTGGRADGRGQRGRRPRRSLLEGRVRQAPPSSLRRPGPARWAAARGGSPQRPEAGRHQSRGAGSVRPRPRRPSRTFPEPPRWDFPPPHPIFRRQERLPGTTLTFAPSLSIWAKPGALGTCSAISAPLRNGQAPHRTRPRRAAPETTGGGGRAGAMRQPRWPQARRVAPREGR